MKLPKLIVRVRRMLLSTVGLVSIVILLGSSDASAQRGTAHLIEMAKDGDSGLREEITATFSIQELRQGTAWRGRGRDFIFAIESESKPELRIDEAKGPETRRISNSSLWYGYASIGVPGTIHSYSYLIAGKRFGGTVDLPVFGPEAYFDPATPSGQLSEKLTITSQIYDGMKFDYWIYVPAQYAPEVPAALMIFQDGEDYVDRDSNNPALNVLDNLIDQKRIPVMISVFVNAGIIQENPRTPTFEFIQSFSIRRNRAFVNSVRSVLYDTVSDRYARFLRDELLRAIASRYNVREDSYSRAISGHSSGGICAFNVAWQMPELFSRVLSWNGTFTSMVWKEDPTVPDGGQDYPDKVLREDKRNLRIWLQDGSADVNQNGALPLGNIRLANALKARGYDFHLSFGNGSHSNAHGAAEFPDELVWLWRDYDPNKSSQAYEMASGEKAKPVFRVNIEARE